VLEACRPYRLLLLPDGAVSSRDQRPAPVDLPLVLAGEGIAADGTRRWDESACARGSLGTIKPSQLIHLLARS
jgi:2,3-bisphosphoglycerate-independent phosphoglycerate mutase